MPSACDDRTLSAMGKREAVPPRDVPGQTALADRFDRYARLAGLGVIPIVLIAVIDLPTGWLADDRALDIALLVASAFVLSSAYSPRRVGRKLRRGELSRPPTRRDWISFFASMVAALLLSAGMGYLIGGWLGAAVLPPVTVVLLAVSLALGIRRHRRGRLGI